MITQERLRELLDYNAETGHFVWRRRLGSDRDTNAWNERFADTIAGGLNGNGYRQIRLDGCRYKAHRLAWLWVHGCWPAADTDHINGDRTDNRIANLREATRAENMRNRGANKNNTSGHKGVTWRRDVRKWHARIVVSRRHIRLGHFDTPEAAAEAYEVAANKYHGEFANTGKTS